MHQIKQFSKKAPIFVALVATLLLLAYAMPVQAGDTLPAVGQGARGANQPSVHGYRAQEFLNWDPRTDPNAQFLRAHVPLQSRIASFAATQAQPNLSAATQMFNLAGDYGNAFFENYQYNDQYSLYLFNFWQYVDYYGSWHGMATESVPTDLYNPADDYLHWFFEFGVLNLPNPAYTNAAHKNGALSLGTIYLPRNGQYYNDWIVQNPDGSFPMADKLIEVAQYFGFDGYFINQEVSITAADVPIYKQFLKHMRDAGLYIQWYDSVTDPTGRLRYQRQLDAANAPFVLDSTFGRVSDSIFLDYPWNETRITASEAYAQSLGLDPLSTVFAGVEAGGDRFGPMRNDLRNAVNPDTGNLRVSVAMLGAEFVQNGLDEDLGTNNPDQDNRAKPAYQPLVFDRERQWWSGPNEDPTHTGRLQTSGSYWDGVANWITARSVLSSTFSTSFNTGHGMQYFVNGEVSNPHQWSNINLQDILPSWQWWQTTSGSKLNVDFDYNTAYQGGSSLVISGTLDSSNDLHLYKTDIPVNNATALSLTYLTGQPAGTASHLRAALIFKDDPATIQYLDVGNTQTTGWNTAVLDLSPFAGRELAMIGLNFYTSDPVPDYLIHIGGIVLENGPAVTPPTPTGFKIDRAFDTGEMYISWNLDDYSQVKLYHLYAELSNGTTVFLGGTYDDVYYIKSLYGETGQVTLVLKAVGADGVEGPAATVTYDYAQEVSNIKVAHSSDTYYTGYLNVSWNQPLTARDGVQIQVTIDNVIDSPVFTETIPISSTQARVIVPLANFQKYALRIQTTGAGGASPGIYVTGNLDDVVPPEPYNGNFNFRSGSTTRSLTLDTPQAYDWWHLYSYRNGVIIPGRLESSSDNVTYKVRGKSTLASSSFGTNAMDWRFTDKSIVTINLEDYRGNISDPSSYILLFNPDSTVSTTDMPDPALRQAIQDQVGGLTYQQVAYYTGSIDLSGIPISDLTGIDLLRSAAEINLSNTGITTIPADTFDGDMLRKLDLSDNPNLTVIDQAFTGLLYPAEIDITGSHNLTTLNLSGSSFEKITADSPDQYPNLTMVDLSGARFDLTPSTPEAQFLAGLSGATINTDGQRPVAYIGPLSADQTIFQAQGTYDLHNLIEVVTARGTDYRLLDGAAFLDPNLDVQQQIANRGLQVQIVNPQGNLVDRIDKSVVGIYQLSFRSLATGADLGTVQVHVIYNYIFSSFLPPIQAGQEIRVQQGAGLPIKFTVTDLQGQPITNVPTWFYVAPIVNGVVGEEIPAVSKGNANQGNTARYDPIANQYVFNLDTGSLAQGSYRVRALFGDATSQSFTLTVR